MSSTSAAWFRTKELAEEVGLTTRTLQRWRKLGIGPAYVKQGRVVRYPRASVDTWAREHSGIRTHSQDSTD